ncbi:MAG: phage portal protein [Pseudomonadota bacterium]
MLEGLFSRFRGTPTARAPASGTGLEAGQYQRRLSGFLPSRQHVNTLVQSSGDTVLARSRYLARNNPYAANAVEVFSAALVGYGIKPAWLQKKSKLKSAGQQLFKDWTDDADAEGLTDFYGLQRRVARELFIAGECFVRRRPRYLSDGFAVPLQIEVIPSEMCPIQQIAITPSGGNVVRQGIEFDRVGRRVAYHFYRRHPGDVTQDPNPDTVRIPASEILHVFDPVEAGQIRGLPRLTPAIVALWSLDAYDDAEHERKKTAAMFAGFIRKPANGEVGLDIEDDGSAAPPLVALEPGTLQILEEGEDITFSTPADVGGAYEAWQYRALTRISAALGLPYMALTSDMVKSNYSNSRQALVEFRRRIEAIQHSVMVFQFCRPVWRWFLDAAALSGALKMPGYATAPRQYLGVNWITPRWEWVDPYKDRQAEVLAIKNGFRARSQTIEAEGEDPEEVDQRIADDAKRAASLGLTFPDVPGITDPNLMPKDGQQDRIAA